MGAVIAVIGICVASTTWVHLYDYALYYRVFSLLLCICAVAGYISTGASIALLICLFLVCFYLSPFWIFVRGWRYEVDTDEDTLRGGSIEELYLDADSNASIRKKMKQRVE